MSDLTSEEIATARRMARKGEYADAIRKALGWDCALETVRNRLRRVGIAVQTAPRNFAHNGDITIVGKG